MARIEATKMGAETLRKLASDLKNSNNNLQICSNTLKSSILGLDNLGDFSVQIMDIVEQIAVSQSQGSEAVEQLCSRLNTLATKIESICSSL